MDDKRPSWQETRRQEASAFRAVLYSHRSLGPRGFLILMLAIGSISFVTGLVFLMMGAWPIMGFFGLDVLLVYIAFRLNYRAGRAFELIELTRETLKLTQVAPTGDRQTFEFNPYWVRVQFSERPDGRTRLSLTSHGSELEFGRLLNDEERRDFAATLRGALAATRSGLAT